MLGGVVNVSADGTIKVRFVLGDDQKWGTPKIYIFYTAGGEYTTWANSPAMTQIYDDLDGKKWSEYFADIPSDKISSVKWIIYNGSNDSEKTSDIGAYDLSTKEYVTYKWYSEGVQHSVQELKYYWYYINSSSFTTLSKTGQSFTGSVDVGSTDNQRYVIVPSYCANESAGTPTGVNSNRWNLVFRPKTDSGDYYVNSWRNWSDDAQTKYNSEDAWKFAQMSGVKYDFSFNANTKAWTLNPYITSTVTTANVATFSSAYAVAIPDGLTASYATGVEGNVLTTTAFVNGIPANTGALLIPNSTIDETTTYKFTPAASTDAVIGNQLVASVSGGAITWTDNAESPTYYNYILTNKTVNGDATPKFYLVNKTSGNTVSAGRAYLQLTEPAPARGYFSLWGDEPTSIEKLTSAKSEGVVYDLQGRKVAQPTKGLYIVNGKKVVLK